MTKYRINVDSWYSLTAPKTEGIDLSSIKYIPYTLLTVLLGELMFYHRSGQPIGSDAIYSEYSCFILLQNPWVLGRFSSFQVGHAFHFHKFELLFFANPNLIGAVGSDYLIYNSFLQFLFSEQLLNLRRAITPSGQNRLQIIFPVL